MAASRAKKSVVSASTEEELDDYRDFGIAEEEDGYDDETEMDEDGEEAPDTIPQEHDRVLDFEDVIGATDLEEEEVYIPEWGGKVVIRSLTKLEFDHMRRVSRSPKNKTRANDVLERELLMAGLVKPAIPSVEKYEMLMNRSAGPMVHILNAIYRKSGLEREAEAARERRFPKK